MIPGVLSVEELISLASERSHAREGVLWSAAGRISTAESHAASRRILGSFLQTLKDWPASRVAELAYWNVTSSTDSRTCSTTTTTTKKAAWREMALCRLAYEPRGFRLDFDLSRLAGRVNDRRKALGGLLGQNLARLLGWHDNHLHPRRRASSSRSDITGSWPDTRTDNEESLDQGIASSAESGVWPYRLR
jgi:hypothetical protein